MRDQSATSTAVAPPCNPEGPINYASVCSGTLCGRPWRRALIVGGIQGARRCHSGHPDDAKSVVR